VRPPAWVHAASIGAGVLAVFVPAFAPEAVGRWEGTRGLFVGAAAAALGLHVALHAVFPRSRLAPGALVAALAVAVFVALSHAAGWFAFAVNLSASGPDLWEAWASRGSEKGGGKGARAHRPLARRS
jgi:hypothetical protein